ncbi:MAG TPA: lipoyl synthase [Candidatus Hydrogenedentes bacterium]|nr:lipoyl synthase [Candidatus Hydrogenedentota bacterium]HOS01476.1 lipoyl synthase [Candidatus Hydrogenedentota bacterium]
MQKRFPAWIRQKWNTQEDFAFTKALVEELNLHTVCQSARCPNQAECWQRRTATFLILGNVCSRRCRFCGVRHGQALQAPDATEPAKIAAAAATLGLAHVVLTSVTRDDLPDGGAAHFAACIRAVHARSPETTVEALTPDFGGDERAIGAVIDAGPEVFAHNIETVRRVYADVRDHRAHYARSLDVLRIARARDPKPIIKSACMAGLGETDEEIRETLEDLLAAGCEAIAIGQYLRPTRDHREVTEFVEPDRFAAYEQLARNLGFGFAVAGPFVRSSYRSAEMMQSAFARERLAPARRNR